MGAFQAWWCMGPSLTLSFWCTWGFEKYSPRFLTWPLKRHLPNREVVLQPQFFRGYVKLQGCKRTHIPHLQLSPTHVPATTFMAQVDGRHSNWNYFDHWAFPGCCSGNSCYVHVVSRWWQRRVKLIGKAMWTHHSQQASNSKCFHIPCLSIFYWEGCHSAYMNTITILHLFIAFEAWLFLISPSSMAVIHQSWTHHPVGWGSWGDIALDYHTTLNPLEWGMMPFTMLLCLGDANGKTVDRMR